MMENRKHRVLGCIFNALLRYIIMYSCVIMFAAFLYLKFLVDNAILLLYSLY